MEKVPDITTATFNNSPNQTLKRMGLTDKNYQDNFDNKLGNKEENESKVQNFNVPSRQSTNSFKDKTKSVSKVTPKKQ